MKEPPKCFGGSFCEKKMKMTFNVNKGLQDGGFRQGWER